MIRHLVLFRFKPDTQADQIADLAGRLGALPGVSPEIKDYQTHPSHLAALELIKSICADIRAVDYEAQGGRP